MQQLSHLEKSDCKEEIFCLKWTFYNGRRKVCLNFKIDTNKLTNVLNPHRNSLYIKENKVDFKLTEHQPLMEKRI